MLLFPEDESGESSQQEEEESEAGETDEQDTEDYTIADEQLERRRWVPAFIANKPCEGRLETVTHIICSPALLEMSVSYVYF